MTGLRITLTDGHGLMRQELLFQMIGIFTKITGTISEQIVTCMKANGFYIKTTTITFLPTELWV